MAKIGEIQSPPTDDPEQLRAREKAEEVRRSNIAHQAGQEVVGNSTD